MLFITIFRKKNIKWFIDITNVVSVVRKGSIKKDLQEIAMKVFEICLVYKTILEKEYFPRN